jgi:hypothetical protein
LRRERRLSFNQDKSRATIRSVFSLSNIPILVSPRIGNKDTITKGFIILSIILITSGLSIWGNLAHMIQEFIVGSQLTHDRHDSEVAKELIHYLCNAMTLGLLILFTWFLFRDSFFKEMRFVQSFIIVALISQSWNLIVNDSAGMERYLYVVIGCISCPDMLDSNTYLSPLHFVCDLIVLLSSIIGYIVYFYQASPYARYKETSKSLR